MLSRRNTYYQLTTTILFDFHPLCGRLIWFMAQKVVPTNRKCMVGNKGSSNEILALASD